VFIPRPETELVAQVAIDALAEQPAAVVVDLCAGSGAVALAVATEVPGAVVHAVEQSAEALAFLKRNVTAYSAAVAVVAGDATDPLLLSHLAGTVDVVTANPPYIPDGMVPREPEVRDHDPDLALYGGPDGLDVARGVVSTAARLLQPGGLLVMEHADVQGESVLQLFGAGWTQVVDHQDYNGLPRYVTARKIVE
jgi:release factor glutamine methyltransferase